jgi:predicted trehalose synthase
MSRAPAPRQRPNGDGRLAGTPRDGARSHSRDERNCAQWFARFDERSEGAAGRPSRSEVRWLRKELEALRRLVTGEQIP